MKTGDIIHIKVKVKTEWKVPEWKVPEWNVPEWNVPEWEVPIRGFRLKTIS
jgi:hypothetical protein